MGRISKEEERARDESYVEDVVTCTAEDLLSEDNGESSSYSHHPKWGVDWHDKWNNHTRNEEALLNLFFLPLCYGELDTETYTIANDDIWQYSQRTKCECLPEHCAGHSTTHQLASSEEVLVTYVEHTEEQCWNECHYHEDHGSLAIRTIVDLRTDALSGSVWGEEESLKTIKQRVESAQLATLFEMRAKFLYYVM